MPPHQGSPGFFVSTLDPGLRFCHSTELWTPQKWPGTFNTHMAAVSVPLALLCVGQASYVLPNPGALFQAFDSWPVSLQVVIKSKQRFHTTAWGLNKVEHSSPEKN